MLRKITIYAFVMIGLFLGAGFCYAQCLPSSDTYYAKQWYLDKLQMCRIWPEQASSKKALVAVIDSGIDSSHPDLHDNIWVNQGEIDGDGLDNDNNGYIDDINGWDFLENDNNPAPTYEPNCLADSSCSAAAVNHGTVVAGVIAAVSNNNIGIAGVAANDIKIMPLRALDEMGTGESADVIEAIDYAIKNKADIINLSFVGSHYELDLEKAVLRAYQAGVLLVASAGNEEFHWEFNNESHKFVVVGQQIDLDQAKRYPVCLAKDSVPDAIIGVGASDQNNKLSSYSNYGSSCLDVIAPGENFFGTLVYNANAPGFDQLYGGNYSGTSLAAPIVSGIAALVKSANPTMTSRQIREVILQSADNIDADNPDYVGKLGKGLIDPVKISHNLLVAKLGGNLVKGSGEAVYYLANDGQRYVFPDKPTFLSWFDDYQGIKKITDAALSKIPLGGVVNFRPGSLVKIQTDPAVYAVAQDGTLRRLKDESTAGKFYGASWQKLVNDVSVAFFVNYKPGAALDESMVYNPLVEKLSAASIDQVKGF